MKVKEESEKVGLKLNIQKTKIMASGPITLLGEAQWLKPSTLARHHSNHLHKLFYDRRSQLHGTNKPPPMGRVWERSKWDTCLTTSQNPSLWHPSWMNKACTTRKDPESEGLAKDNPETNPITIKPRDCEPCDRAVLLGSLTLLLSTQAPFPNKTSCFVSTCLLGQFISKCQTRARFQALEEVLLPATTSWQIDGETMETVRDLIYLGSKITADDDCSHEIKTRLLLGRKAMINLDSILKAETWLCPQKSI